MGYARVPAGWGEYYGYMDRRLSQLEQAWSAPSAAAPVVVYPPGGGGGGGGVVLSQVISPVTDVRVVPGAFYNSIYADVFWNAPSDGSAVQYEITWAQVNADGTYANPMVTRTSGNTFRLHSLAPNTPYAVQVTAVNIIGMMAASPYVPFTSTNDSTIPQAVSNVVLGQGATSIIVKFDPLTVEQSPDVASGNGVYQVDISQDSTFATVFRTVRSGAFVVAFNDVNPKTTLSTDMKSSDVSPTLAQFKDNLLAAGFPTTTFRCMVEQELIDFTSPSGTQAQISVRNTGANAPVGGQIFHPVGSAVVLQTQGKWYARVAAIDASNNMGPWSYSSTTSPQAAGGVVDSMMVGDFSAAHITFGSMKGDRIETNTLIANAIKTSSLTASTITLAGGAFSAGNPPTTGLIINSQGIRLYAGGIANMILDAPSGVATFTGTINGSTITGSTITGGSFSTAPVSGTYINIWGTELDFWVSGPTLLGSFKLGGQYFWYQNNAISPVGYWNYSFQFSSSTDGVFGTGALGNTYGRGCQIGTYPGSNAYAGIGHYDRWSSSGYALIQGGNNAGADLGRTIVNSESDVRIRSSNAEAFVIASAGGTSYLYSALNLASYNLACNVIYAQGGSFTTKPFTIPHPHPELSETHHLTYSSIEGPRPDLIWRGKVKLKSGVAVVDLDIESHHRSGTYEHLVDLKTAQAFLYNENGEANLRYVLSGPVLTITSDDHHSATVGWMVIATRNDSMMRDSIFTDKKGRWITERHNDTHPMKDVLVPAPKAALPEGELLEGALDAYR